MMTRIALVTTTRADWGLLRPLAERLRSDRDVDLCIIASNMHLMPRFGMTVDEIVAAGFDVHCHVPMPDSSDTPTGRAEAAATCMAGMVRAFSELQPDMVVILGDRYEILAVASAAAIMAIPIVHISGGEITLGAIDDNIRHAVTKLASLHLTATEAYRRRVIQMGEQPSAVVNAGALGVWNALNRPIISVSQLSQSLGFDLSGRFALATCHPVSASPEDTCAAMLGALDAFPDMKVVLTYPNNDAGADSIISRITAYADARPGKVVLVRSLGMDRYISAATHAAVVAGNSSSGVVEVPSCGTPSVNIGIRQLGRIAAPSVIHCEPTTEAVIEAIAEAISPEFSELASKRINPYYRPDTPEIMHQAIMAFAQNPSVTKPFNDIPYA